MLIRLEPPPAQAEPVKLISSPCVKICTLIDKICVGCGRTQEEIKEWFTATDERKKEIKESCGKRV